MTAAVAAAPVTFTVTEKPLRGRRREIGRLTLTAVRTDAAAFSFDPALNSVTQVRPVRLLSRLRELAYTGSRRGCHADPAALRRTPTDATAAGPLPIGKKISLRVIERP